MNPFQQAKIYAIRSRHTDKVYIGSTHTTLNARFSQHKSDLKLYNNQRRNYRTSYEILKFPDAYIELIEEFPCECKYQLIRREGEILKSNPNRVNLRIEGRTQKEYRQDKKLSKEQNGNQAINERR